MLKIKQIYKDYNIMPNLQMHQIRVAAVALLLIESVKQEVNKEEICIACLIHDMGNIIKFNLDYFPELNYPEGKEYWLAIKNDYINKYGRDEKKANLKIAKELNAGKEIEEIIKSIDDYSIDLYKNNNKLSKIIAIYADFRVGPFGILSIEERLEEVKERYKNQSNFLPEIFEKYTQNYISNIEKNIFSDLNIKPEDINDKSINIFIIKIKKLYLD